MINITDVLREFDVKKKIGPNSWQCKCPTHNDKEASLTITAASDKILLHCHAGCATKEILDAVGLGWDAVGESDKETNEEVPEWRKGLVDKYDYMEPYTNKYLFSKLRYEHEGRKVIRYAVINKNEVVRKGKNEGDYALFNVNNMLKAISNGVPVFYAEGEKDCRTLQDLGYVCVTAGSASDWRKEYAQYFKGAKLTIFADHDKSGKALAEKVQHDVMKYCWCSRIITPCEEDKGDITDELDKKSDKESKRTRFEEIRNSEEYIYPRWIIQSKDKVKVNPDLFANNFIDNNHLIVVKSVESDNDLYYIYDHGVYVRVSKSEIESKMSEYMALGNANSSVLTNAVRFALNRAKRYRFNELNTNEEVINVKNGLVNIRTKKLEPHTPKMLTTVQLNCEYHPDKVIETPNWNKFINDFCTSDETIDEEMKDSLLQYLGLIISNLDGSKAKKCCMMYSPNGNSGKSKMIDIVTKLIGSENVAVISFAQMSNSRWATSAAYGKRLISVGDQGATQIDDSSVFKQITGGDELDAEFKGKDKFKFKFKGCILIGTNTLPYFSDDKGNHMAERLLILHCRNSIPAEKRDINIAEKCYEERDGIFVQLLDALGRLVDNNLVLPEGESSKLSMDEYRMKSDTLYYFVRTCCRQDDNESILASEFNDAYATFCKEKEINAVSVRNIPARMEALGINKKLRDGYYYYSGITTGDITEMLETTDIPF